MAKRLAKLLPTNTNKVKEIEAVAEQVHQEPVRKKTKKVRFNFELPESLKDRIERYKAETGLSATAQTTEALNQYFRERNFE